ncbi:hypothetical protein [Thalassospira xiamenensis]|uniref:hypothetical protein n=1 Tax=Thalassospira xiamenensis TaxID=220697 RepID=UPI000DED3F6B|nr:hypothetical protein [Thalassospira xiamenensis]RCK40466.1 hypothetical protein TH24_11040 [Thalassospira xiamenensis]
MSNPVKNDPYQELIAAARGLLIDILARAPQEALAGMSPEAVLRALCNLSPADAEKAIKEQPEGAASVRLAQAIRQAERAKP